MRIPIMLTILFVVATLSVAQAAESAADPLTDEKKLVKERLTEKPDTVILAVDDVVVAMRHDAINLRRLWRRIVCWEPNYKLSAVLRCCLNIATEYILLRAYKHSNPILPAQVLEYQVFLSIRYC